MTNEQESRANRNLAVIEFSNENENITAELPGYVANLGIFAQATAEIQTISGEQQTDLTGISASKTQLRSNMTGPAFETSLKLVAFAKMSENNTLLKEVNYSETNFRKSSEIKALDYSQIVYDRAQKHIDSLAQYRINQSTQLILFNAINSFKKVMAAPRIGATTKSQATKRLVALFKLADAALIKMDATVEIVRFSDPNFYIGYKSARKIISKGTGKLAVKGLVSDAQTGEPVKGVTVSFAMDGGMVHLSSVNAKPNVVKITATKGGFNIKSLAAGTYAVSFKKAGYAEQTATVNVNDGEMTMVEVMMVKN